MNIQRGMQDIRVGLLDSSKIFEHSDVYWKRQCDYINPISPKSLKNYLDWITYTNSWDSPISLGNTLHGFHSTYKKDYCFTLLTYYVAIPSEILQNDAASSSCNVCYPSSQCFGKKDGKNRLTDYFANAKHHLLLPPAFFVSASSLKGSRYSLLATITIWTYFGTLKFYFGTLEPISGIFPYILLLRRTYQNGHDSSSINQEPGMNWPTSNRDLHTFCIGSTQLWSNLYFETSLAQKFKQFEKHFERPNFE